METLKSRIESIPQEPTDGWISVEDGLPEEDVKIIVSAGKRGVNEAFYGELIHNYGKGFMYKSKGTLVGVTHWQPLPNPPKQ